MATPSKGKISVNLIDKAHLYRGKKNISLDFVIWPNKNGEDEYGNTHVLIQDLGKEARERGEKGAIIGNIKWVETEQRPAPRPAPPKPKGAHDPNEPDADDLAF